MILVTGAGGFIGSNLCVRLNDAVPLDRSYDITDPACFDNLSLQPKIVVHLAGYIEINLDADRENIWKIYDVNLMGTVNVLGYCLKAEVKHLIFASSQAVYGMPMSRPLQEDSPCKPIEHYANSKLCAEQVLRTCWGVKTTILRFPGVYSEKRKSGIVYNFMKQALNEKKIQTGIDCPLPIDVIYLEDVLNAFEATALTGKAGCYNIATGEPCSVNILADRIAELVPGCKVEHSKVKQPVVQMDIRKAMKDLGWKPQQDGLQKMFDKLIEQEGYGECISSGRAPR
ncbi:MAG: NAD(P)-dependent oxidoreductase [Kiritimatiellae bacterium]|nr:NAD(P)-dependent oxidoreductase [Kiritimatiellia bacterium]